MRFKIFSALLLVGATLLVNPLTDCLVDHQSQEASLRIKDVDALDGMVDRELHRLPTKAELKKMYNTKAKRRCRDSLSVCGEGVRWHRSRRLT